MPAEPTDKVGSLARTHGDRPGLPRGTSSLGRDAVRLAQRERLLHAMVSVAAEGYAAATVGEVVARARVSRSVFYAHFADKEGCFLAACDEGVELMFARITQAVRESGRAAGGLASPEQRSRASVHAYLQFLVDEPQFASCFLVQAFAAGDRAIVRLADVQARFAASERRWYEHARRERPELPRLPGEVHIAMVGAIHQLVVGYVRSGRTDRLLSVEDVIVTMHVAIHAGWPAT